MRDTIVVIGGGVGGLGVAALLAREGHKVSLIEPYKHLGGRCSAIEKDGFDVPTYVHAFPKAEHGFHTRLVEKLGGSVAWVKQEDAIMNVNGREISFSMISLQKNFISMYKAGVPLREMLKMGGRMVKNMAFNRRMWDQDLDNVDVRTWLNRYTQDKTIHTLVSCFTSACFVVPYYEASMGEFFPVMKDIFKHKGGGYPVAGCNAFTLPARHALEKAGGQILSNRVERIIVENNRATGIELEGGEIIEAAVIISNAGIKPTVLDLVGEAHFSADYFRRIQALTHSMSSLAVQIALDKKVTDLRFFTYIPPVDSYDYYKQMERGELPGELMLWFCSGSNLSPSLVPEGKQLIACMSPVPYLPDEDWVPWIERLVEGISRFIPGVSEHTLWRRTVTPKNIEQWSGKEGTVVGIGQRVGQVQNERPSMTSPIEGLYFVGADVTSGAVGIELASKSAMECAEVVDRYLRSNPT